MAILRPAFLQFFRSGPRRVPERRSVLTLLWISLFLLAAGPSGAQVSREYRLKAVFLFHFAQFAEWPQESLGDTNEPFVICVLGTDPFGPVLEEVVRGETVHGRKLTVERHRRVEDIKRCHILFISQSENRQLERIVETLKGRPVLTVSDLEGAAYRGVMIRLVTESNRIRLRVNLEAVKNSKIVLSSKLLRVAEIIASEEKR